MNLYSIKALFKKEISDIFRDKKTLFMMVVIPLVLYPLLIVGMTLFMSSVMQNQVETVYKVAFENVPCIEQLQELLDDEDQEFTYKIEVVNVEDASKALSDSEIDAYVSFVCDDKDNKQAFLEDENGIKSLNGTLKITYYEANNDSSTAKEAVEELLNCYQDILRSENIRKLQLDEDAILYPLPYKAAGLSSVEENIGNAIGSAIPMMIIISILMGAMYPAIDVTAGEKERGTLETLLTLPVTNFEMIASKFLAVSVIACVSAVLNIISMSGACGFMMSMLAEGEGGMHINFANFIPAILITMVVMIAFALFTTAICMCVCVFAKSFKEANNYITPVMLVLMFGGMASMIPDLELSSQTAAIPVINVSLLIKGLFKLKCDYALLGVVFVSNVIYSLLTVLILSKIYDSEAILFSEGLSSVKIVTKRSDMKKGQMPGFGDVILLCSITMLLFLYAGTMLQLKFGFWGVLYTQLMIICVPLLYAWYIRTDFKKLFSIKMPKLKQLIGSFVLWIGGYAVLLVISVMLSLLMKESAQNVQSTFDEFMKQPVYLLILVIAVLPAICEETLFRGFLFGTMKQKTKRITAILVVSALFGIYHMSLIKFFTTTLLGIMFAYAVSESESIFCSMLMHFCNNLTSVLVMKYEKQITDLLPILVKTSFQVTDVVLLLVIGAVGIAAGVLLLRVGKKGRV